MRVLHIIPTLTGGGAENFLCALITNFDEQIVTAGIMAIYPTDVPLPDEARARVPVIQIRRTGRYDPGFFGRMCKEIRAFRPDIVHAHLHNGKYWGRLAALCSRVPIVVFTEHNPCGEERIFPEFLVDVLVNRLTDGIVTFAERQRAVVSHAERLPLASVSVIENGIALPAPPQPQLREDARRALELHDETLAVVVLARLIKRKNQQLAIRMIRVLAPEARRRVRLFLTGGGQDEAELRRLAAAEGVSEHVAFLGHRDDATALLYGADVMYMPSLAEGMPLAMLEAMSIGVPIVSTPWTGVYELLRDGELGTIVNDWEPSSSARVLESFLASPAAFHAIADRASRYVRDKHDIRRVARLHEELYATLASRHGIPA
jgi:glycosyltransferase involved in cell wall biosynthesis